jgi:hypothetical protein
MARLTLIAAAFAALVVAGCDKEYDDDKTPPPPPPTVISGSGDLTDEIAQFRTLIGDPLNGTPNQTIGRREINWDGGSPDITNKNNFPLDFFNPTDAASPDGRKRGLVYVGNNAALRLDSTSYAEIEATYANNFKPFSGKKLVTSINSNVTEIELKVAGTNTPASVKGFGAVFSDVDQDNYTTIQFYDGNKSLGVFKVPVRSDANGHSFLGVHFPNDKITRIKITLGTGTLAAGTLDITNDATNGKDLVVLDDFFYSEPLAL